MSHLKTGEVCEMAIEYLASRSDFNVMIMDSTCLIEASAGLELSEGAVSGMSMPGIFFMRFMINNLQVLSMSVLTRILLLVSLRIHPSLALRAKPVSTFVARGKANVAPLSTS